MTEQQVSMDAEVRTEDLGHCAYCLKEIPVDAVRCPHCQSAVANLAGPIDNATRIVIARTKDEVARWTRNYFAVLATVMGVLGSVLTFLLGLFLESSVANATEETDDRIEAVEASIVGLEGTITEVTRQQDEARRTVQALLDVAINGDLRVLRSELRSALWRAEEPGVLPPKLAGAIAPVLSQPVSLADRAPALIYGGSVRLYWHGVATDGLSGPRYRVEWSGAPLPNDRAGSVTLPVGRTSFDLEIGDGVDEVRGVVYWRAGLAIGDDTEWSRPAVFEAYPSAMARIQDLDEVRVGISAYWESGFCRYDDGELTGFDIELTREIVERIWRDESDLGQKWKPRFIAYDWFDLLGAVKRNEVDLIISAITIKPEREQYYDLDFSDSYYTASQVVGYLASNDELDELEGAWVEGKEERRALIGARNDVAAVTAGTTSEQLADRMGADVMSLPHERQVISAVRAGDADYAIMDDFLMTTLAKDFAQMTVVEEDYGIGVGENQAALLKAVNRALEGLGQDRLDELEQRFLGAGE